MAFFKIGEEDFSSIVNSLTIKKTVKYNAQTNAAGNTVVDYINSKRTIEVGIIPLNDAAMLRLQLALNAFSVSLSFINPETNVLEENVACIIPNTDTDYYTIQQKKVMFNPIKLSFTEL